MGNDRNEQKKEHIKVHRRLEHWQIIALYLIVYDFITIGLSYFAALWIRFDCQYQKIPEEYLNGFKKSILIYAGVCILIYWLARLYHSMWRFASYKELIRVTGATIVTSLIHIVVMNVFVQKMPVSYFIFGVLAQFAATLGIRFAYRLILLLRGRRNREVIHKKRVMLVGAGSSGQMIIRDMKHTKEINEQICCIIDDNSNKWGRFIDDIPIVGGRNDIPSACEKYRIDKIYVAIPSASAKAKKDILNICNETGCELMNLPGMFQFYTGQVTVSSMKEVAVEDLLGREPIRVDMNEIFQYIKGKVILVTGGGGSIGSELCRQIAAHEPKQLIIFDIYENNAHAIGLELKDNYPDLNLEVLIGSVRDSRRINQVFKKYRPEVVYHAAAHKHVPLMEDSPCESIKNNAIGTYKTAHAAMMNGCKRFVLISTDKAVNPTNIMALQSDFAK